MATSSVRNWWRTQYRPNRSERGCEKSLMMLFSSKAAGGINVNLDGVTTNDLLSGLNNLFLSALVQLLEDDHCRNIILLRWSYEWWLEEMNWFQGGNWETSANVGDVQAEMWLEMRERIVQHEAPAPGEGYGGPEVPISQCKSMLNLTTTIKRAKRIIKKQHYILKTKPNSKKMKQNRNLQLKSIPEIKLRCKKMKHNKKSEKVGIMEHRWLDDDVWFVSFSKCVLIVHTLIKVLASVQSRFRITLWQIQFSWNVCQTPSSNQGCPTVSTVSSFFFCLFFNISFRFLEMTFTS